MKQQRILFPDEVDAIAYRLDKEVRVWAVDIASGSNDVRPTATPITRVPGLPIGPSSV